MTTQQKTESLTELTRKGICIEFFSAYQDLDINRMIALCNPEGEVYFQPLGEAGKGTINNLGRHLWLALMDCFPDLDNTVDSAAAQDDTIECKVTVFGTQQKDFAGIPSKGLRFDSDHIFIFRFNRVDKIKNITITWDHASFKQQLGSYPILSYLSFLSSQYTQLN
jgi:predicted ester cyclase